MPTRKPEELSRRQRKRHTKFLSRKEEFSGGSCSGLYVSADGTERKKKTLNMWTV